MLVTGDDIIWVVFLRLDTKIIAAPIQLHTVAQMKSMEPYRSAYSLPDMQYIPAVPCARSGQRGVVTHPRVMDLFRCKVA